MQNSNFSVCKLLWMHSRACSCMYCLGLLLSYTLRTEETDAFSRALLACKQHLQDPSGGQAHECPWEILAAWAHGEQGTCSPQVSPDSVMSEGWPTLQSLREPLAVGVSVAELALPWGPVTAHRCPPVRTTVVTSGPPRRVCCCLVIKSCQTLCNPTDCSDQVPLSMGVSRQEHWSGLPFPSSGDLFDPGIERRSSALQADFLTAEPPGTLHRTPACVSMLLLFSRSVVSNSAAPWTAARRAPLSITISRSLLRLTSSESMMPPNHPILCPCPAFSLFQHQGLFHPPDTSSSSMESLSLKVLFPVKRYPHVLLLAVIRDLSQEVLLRKCVRSE